jgi:hypothetical protein
MAWMGALGSAIAKGAGKVASSKAAKAVGNNLKGKFSPQKGGDQGGGQQKGGKEQPQKLPPMQVAPPQMKKGGPIKKTGVYLLHKNEYVVPAKHRSSGKRASHKKTVIKA